MNFQPPFPVVANLSPREGTRAARIDLSFPADNGGIIDLSMLQNQGELFQCQTLFVDNSANDKTLFLQSSMMLQKISVPAGSQGYIPILAPNPPRFTVTCDSANAPSAIFALNYSVSPSIWGFQSTQAITGQVEVTNFPAVQAVSQSGAWVIDVSNFPAGFLSAQSGAWNVSINNFPAVQAVSQSGAWAVEVNNFPASFQVSNFPASFQVSNFPAVQAVSQSGAWSVGVNNFPAVQPTEENNLPVFASTAIAVNSSAVVLANTASYKYLRSVEIFCYNATVAASDTFFVIDGTGNGIYPVSVPPLANYTGTLARISGLNIPKISDNTFAWGFLAKSLSSGYAMTTCGFGN